MSEVKVKVTTETINLYIGGGIHFDSVALRLSTCYAVPGREQLCGRIVRPVVVIPRDSISLYMVEGFQHNLALAYSSRT